VQVLHNRLLPAPAATPYTNNYIEEDCSRASAVAAACSRDKWGNGMQSEEAATSSTATVANEATAASQAADQAAVTTTVAAAGAGTP
jgi:hypothetical protein